MSETIKIGDQVKLKRSFDPFMRHGQFEVIELKLGHIRTTPGLGGEEFGAFNPGQLEKVKP